LSDKELRDFLKEINALPGWRKAFFGARANRLPEDEMLSYDATEIASEGGAVEILDLALVKGFQHV
jgi:hypothetical protein